MAEEDSCATQLINGEGEFNKSGLETFTRTVKLSELGISYAVVAIMGPQSSGKSTLLNHLFRTNFLEMDESKGRSQTTKGIWIARAVGIAPCTVIMDLEGSDGKERGKKDETAFEKQNALFALAVSDVVLINMWCHDIGRELAANRPLLKTAFQVMTQLFSPRKTTLLFVIRDKTMTPLEYLEAALREDMKQIWDTVQKPQAFKDTPLSHFFNVEVTALSCYVYKEDQFKEQVGQLRQQFFNSIAPGGLAGDRRGVVPASGFSNWAEKIWKDIKENRDLDLPAHRVMLASVRCDEIGSEQLTRLTSDESWLSLEEAVQAGPVPGFVQRLSSILETYLSEYDTMTLYYDENVRKTKRQELESKALQLVHPAYVIFLQQLRSETLESFKMSLEQTLHKGEAFASSVGKCTQACMKKFDFSCAGKSGKQTYWDASKVRGELLRDIEYTTNYHHPNIQKTQKKRSEMAPAFPKYVVLQSKHDMKYLAVAEDSYAFTAGGDQVLSPLSKFNLEKAKTKKGFFNIRSCYNNKYVASKGADSSDIGVGAAEPNEDPSQWSSTLVELVPTAGDVTSVKIRFANRRNFFTVEGEETQFTVINWESLMNLPKYVVLKGDNGKYLKLYDGFFRNGVHNSSLKFDGSDTGDLALVHQVLPVGDGTIMMKPMLQKCSSAIHWHHWKSGMIGLNYPPSRFMPVKAGSNSIALRCMDNNLFCRIHPKVNGVKDTLVADSESIIKESRFIVEESFLSRDIFDMDFRLMHARIYDQTVVTIITRDATNHSSSAETIDLKLTYTDTSTRTWDRSRGLKLGSSATIKAGVPSIAEGEVKLSADFEGSYKWGETQQTSTQIETTHTITVPPKTRVKARLLATRGKCDVPFSYTVRDVLIDGREFIHNVDDGIYTGTNTYNFKFETTEEKLF